MCVLQGKCMKQVQDAVERLWDFIDKLDINTFGNGHWSLYITLQDVKPACVVLAAFFF